MKKYNEEERKKRWKKKEGGPCNKNKEKKKETRGKSTVKRQGQLRKERKKTALAIKGNK